MKDNLKSKKTKFLLKTNSSIMHKHKLNSYGFLTVIVFILLAGLLLGCNIRSQNKTHAEEITNNELIKIEFDNNRGPFKINEEYHIRLKTQIDKKSIVVTSNNGMIKKSDNEGFDYVILPKKHGELTLRFYANKDLVKTEVYTTTLKIE